MIKKRFYGCFLILFFSVLLFGVESDTPRGIYVLDSDNLGKEIKDSFVLIAREVNGESFFYLGKVINGEVIDTGLYLPSYVNEEGKTRIFQPLLSFETKLPENLDAIWEGMDDKNGTNVRLKKIKDVPPVFLSLSSPDGELLNETLSSVINKLEAMTSVQVQEYSLVIKGKKVVWDLTITNVWKEPGLETFIASFTDQELSHSRVSGILHQIPALAAHEITKGETVKITAQLTDIQEKEGNVFIYLKFMRMN